VDISLSAALRRLDCVDLVVVVHILVFVLLQIKEWDEPSVVNGCEYQTREWTPSDVYHWTTKREVHHRVGLVHVPYFDSEVCRTRDKRMSVVVIPVNVVHRQFVPTLSLQIGTCLWFGAFVDSSLFGTDQEFTVIVFRTEVEAECSCLLCDCGFVIFGTLVARNLFAVQLKNVNCCIFITFSVFLEFKHHDDFALQFAFD